MRVIAIVLSIAAMANAGGYGDSGYGGLGLIGADLSLGNLALDSGKGGLLLGDYGRIGLSSGIGYGIGLGNADIRLGNGGAGDGGVGFGPGGYYSPVPRQEIRLVSIPTPVAKPVPVPVDRPYTVKVDQPYTVKVDQPYASPYIAKVLQPVIDKKTVISTQKISSIYK